MSVDLTAFRATFTNWADCTNAELQFWAELSACIINVPTNATGIKAKLPILMLAHVLTINNVKCSAAPAEATDDAFLTQMLGSGSRINSASLEGISVSFDNNGISNAVAQIGGGPFGSWLAQTTHGQMIAVMLQMLYAGPHMAVSPAGSDAVFADDSSVIGHIRKI